MTRVYHPQQPLPPEAPDRSDADSTRAFYAPVREAAHPLYRPQEQNVDFAPDDTQDPYQPAEIDDAQAYAAPYAPPYEAPYEASYETPYEAPYEAPYASPYGQPAGDAYSPAYFPEGFDPYGEDAYDESDLAYAPTEEIYVDDTELLTEEEVAELRRNRWQTMANLWDFLGVIVGASLIVVLLALLFSLLNWLGTDIRQSFTLWQTRI